MQRSSSVELTPPSPVNIWGVPLTPFTREQTLDYLALLIQERCPSYFITANLHYAMLTHRNQYLREVNEQAAFILADGMPMVWASRHGGNPLPERVAGSDLLFLICERAAREGWKLYFLGGAPGIGELAADRLQTRYPGLQIVGIDAPPFRALSCEEKAEMLDRIRTATPDILFVAFGQPKGELWIAEHYQELGVPVSVQVGASLDFAAGKVRRAPRWMQRTGLEWIYRIMQEPRRLLGRYLEDIRFLFRMMFGPSGRRTRKENG